MYTEHVDRAVESCRFYIPRSVILIYIYICICMYLYIYLCICLSISHVYSVQSCFSVHICMYVCMYVYMYVYIYTIAILILSVYIHIIYSYYTGRLGSLAVFQAEFCDPIRAGGFAGANVLKVYIHRLRILILLV